MTCLERQLSSVVGQKWELCSREGLLVVPSHKEKHTLSLWSELSQENHGRLARTVRHTHTQTHTHTHTHNPISARPLVVCLNSYLPQEAAALSPSLMKNALQLYSKAQHKNMSARPQVNIVRSDFYTRTHLYSHKKKREKEIHAILVPTPTHWGPLGQPWRQCTRLKALR